MRKPTVTRALPALLTLIAPAFLAGCPVYVDSWAVLDSSPTYGSPNVTVVGETVPGWIDIDRPRYTSKKGDPALNPVINSFSANITQVQPGQPITFTVVANDPGNQPLQYNWSATGGTLSANTGQIVSWDPPERAAVYTISVIVSNARGGATTGALNLTVKSTDGVVKATPTPAPVATPTPTPVPTPTPIPSPNATAAAPTPTPAATTAPHNGDTAAITGVVNDDAGPVADAEVVLTMGDELNATVKTDAQGRYRFDSVPAGVRLVLEARKAGYGFKQRTVFALKGSENTFDFSGSFALAKL